MSRKPHDWKPDLSLPMGKGGTLQRFETDDELDYPLLCCQPAKVFRVGLGGAAVVVFVRTGERMVWVGQRHPDPYGAKIDSGCATRGHKIPERGG